MSLQTQQQQLLRKIGQISSARMNITAQLEQPKPKAKPAIKKSKANITHSGSRVYRTKRRGCGGCSRNK